MIQEPPTAFPWSHDEMTCTGMSLRDYFAAKAMQGILSICEDNGDAPFWDIIAPDAYKMADAMLKARDGNS
jgi:hypothetical protein